MPKPNPKLLPLFKSSDLVLPVCLAPMVGLSHVAFRELLRGYMPVGAKTIWPSEMLNSRRVPHENLSETPEAMRSENESDWVPQILGNEEEPIRRSVEKLFAYGASGIDINMGCPVRKALQHNYGVALMGDPEYAFDVVRMTVRHARGPVSVKLRAGPEGSLEFLENFAKGLERAGAGWLCLHPRTAEQKRRGRADWSQLKFLQERIEIPLVGNGDIQTCEDVFSMLSETGVAMTMAGRALTARPWLFWQVGEKLGMPRPAFALSEEGSQRRAPETPEEEAYEYGFALKKLLETMVKYFPENLVLRKFRFFVRTGSVWLNYGHDLVARLSRAKTLDETRATLDAFFALSGLSMVPRTELRQ